MNILAHACLSGEQPGVILGNFIGDFIKGDPAHERHGLPPDWQTGVRLHRLIDSFTDEHPVSVSLRKLLHPYCHKYAGVALDVLYDHFLALNFQELTGQELNRFVKEFYNCVLKHRNALPYGAQRLSDYMIDGNWLVSYRTPDGISRALTGLARRTAFPSHLDLAVDCLTVNYTIFATGFADFFPDLQRTCLRWLAKNGAAA